MATVENRSETCSICIEKFKKPKILPCFHTFCLDCLQKFVSSSSKNGQFPCPICRFELTLPKEGVTGFQTNFYVEATAEKEEHGGGECCGMCEQRVSHSCRECVMLLCDACTQYHLTLPATRSHLLINLTDSDSAKPLLSQQRFCQTHLDEKLRFYCKACNKVICRDCKLTDHEGHKTVNIVDVVVEARTSLAKTKVKLETYKTKIDESYDKITLKKSKMSENMKNANTEINKFADTFLNSLEEIINTSRSKHLLRVTDEEQIQRKKFSDEQHTLSQRKCFIQSQIDQSDVMLSEGLDCDVISSDCKMKQRLTKIEKKQSTGSDCDSQPVYIPPIPAVNPGQLEAVRCAVNDVMINAFACSERNALIRIVKTIKHDCAVRFICFTKSQNVLIWETPKSFLSFISSHCLCLYQKSSLKRIWQLKVTMDELRVKGVHGVIDEHNITNPDNKIPADDYTDLKKSFPYMDSNDEGDKCYIDHNYNMVIIKTVNGVVRTLTFNPFGKTGQHFKPVDVCWGKHQEVYIADSGADMIVVYSLHHGFQKSLKRDFNIERYRSELSAIAMDGDGKLWVGNTKGYVHICNVE